MIQRSLHRVVDFLLCAGSFSESGGAAGQTIPWYGFVS